PAAGVMTYVWQSSKKNGQIEIGIFLANQAMTQASLNFPATSPPGFAITNSTSQPVGGIPYQIVTQMADAVDGNELQSDGTNPLVHIAMDVCVAVPWPGGYPVTRATRVFKHAVQMESP